MAQISPLGAYSDSAAQIAAGDNAGLLNKSGKAASSSSRAAISDEAQTSPLQAQLTRLSGVLSSLQTNATTNRTQYLQALDKVKSGTYEVNPALVSQSIVKHALVDNGK